MEYIDKASRANTEPVADGGNRAFEFGKLGLIAGGVIMGVGTAFAQNSGAMSHDVASSLGPKAFAVAAIVAGVAAVDKIVENQTGKNIMGHIKGLFGRENA